jgi:hypothetical protein
MHDSQKLKPTFPRLYTIHSQKGGVGKTTVSIAIAAWAAVYHKKRALIIDADMTGVSLIDIPDWKGNAEVQYFNDLILAKPNDFAKYGEIWFEKTANRSKDGIQKFCRRIPKWNKIKYMPASPCFEDISKVVPLITQENFLKFFQHRLEDIIAMVIKDQYEVIIIDHPPGLHGISIASLNITCNDSNDNKGKFEHKITKKSCSSHAILTTTPDPPDYLALFPSLFCYLSGNEPDSIDIFLNKATMEARFDPPIAYQYIFDDLKEKTENSEFKDKREGITVEWINKVEAKAKNKGGLAGSFIPGFKLNDIFPTIKRIRENPSTTKRYGGIEGWCTQVGEMIGLYSSIK